MSASFRDLRVWQQSMELRLAYIKGLQRSPGARYTDWRSRCAEPLCQYPAISLKAKDTDRTRNSFGSFCTREAR